MIEYLPNNPNEYKLDGNRFIKKIKRIGCEVKDQDAYILCCKIRQRGDHEYTYIPGNRFITKQFSNRVLWLDEDALAAAEEAVKRFDERVNKARGWKGIMATCLNETITIHYHRVMGKKYEFYLECRNKDILLEKFYSGRPDEIRWLIRDIHGRMFRDSMDMSLFDIMIKPRVDNIIENPLYKAAVEQGDEEFLKVLKLHYGLADEEEGSFLAKFLGRRILPSLPEEYNRKYVVDSDTIDSGLLDRSGYRILHRPYFAMQGSTHSKWTINPHTKGGVDAAKDEEASISFMEYLELFNEVQGGQIYLRILYLHGIGSGADSRTPRTLRTLLPEAEIVAPELPIRPSEAVKFIRDNYLDKEFDLVIGTSLGGFYAQTMWQHKKILVNPAMYADEDIAKAIGYGRHEFLCERSDGAKEYTIDESFISELAEIRKMIYGNKDMMHPEKLDVNECNLTYALFGENDTLVSHYDDFCKWYIPGHAYRFAGGHRMETEETKNVLLPLIEKVVSEPDTPLCFAMDNLRDDTHNQDRK